MGKYQGVLKGFRKHWLICNGVRKKNGQRFTYKENKCLSTFYICSVRRVLTSKQLRQKFVFRINPVKSNSPSALYTELLPISN